MRSASILPSPQPSPTPGGRERQHAILLVKPDHGREIIAHCCPHSASRGVVLGMTLAHARALLSHVHIIEAIHEPQRDELALRALASWAMRFTPLVAPDPPDGLLLDVSGCTQLYGDERRMLNAIGNTIERLGFHARLACASTIGCAWAVARFGPHERTIVERGAERAAIEPLPIESLRVDPHTIEELHEVNVDCVGQALALSRLELIARYPADLLRRIDQALGEATEVIQTIEPQEPIQVERAFDGAVTQLESLLITGRELIDQAAATLLKLESGAMRLTLVIERLGSAPIRLDLRLSRPSRDAKHLWSLLLPRVETVNMGFGVERVSLIISIARRLPHQQGQQWVSSTTTGDELDRASGELIDTLTHRLGAECTLRMQTVESHQPERVAVRTPAMNSSESRVPSAECPSMLRTRNSELGTHTLDRPSILLEQPEPIEVMAVTPPPDSPPIWLKWRGIEHRIVNSRGPERIGEEWWRTSIRQPVDTHQALVRGRDYFSVQDDTGRWLWVFYDSHQRRWFVHGEWI
jgi:protein ImuB